MLQSTIDGILHYDILVAIYIRYKHMNMHNEIPDYKISLVFSVVSTLRFEQVFTITRYVYVVQSVEVSLIYIFSQNILNHRIKGTAYNTYIACIHINSNLDVYSSLDQLAKSFFSVRYQWMQHNSFVPWH